MLKKLLAVTAVAALLAGCSTTGSGANGGAPVDDGTAGIQTSGVGGYGDSDSGLTNPNAMVPGADQRYFFDFNQSVVHSSDLPSIKVQAHYLISHPSAKAVLQGNTDRVGSREYNLALGQRRADAVKQTLLLDGASKDQLSTISFGSEKPISDEDAQNRRVDMKYGSH